MKPRHIAIIMDGNGRWAQARGKPRLNGHKAGAEAVRRTIKAARNQGVEFLTLYAFSIENWTRPATEVRGLMSMLYDFLADNAHELMENEVRLRAMGRLSDLPAKLQAKLAEVEKMTANNARATLVIAISYGGRTEIANAAKDLAMAVAAGTLNPSSIDEAALASRLYLPDVPDPDLVIRTSGEQRLSNFLLWQCAYSEFYFTNTLWPDFGEADLAAAVAEYSRRHRRFGGLEDTDGDDGAGN